jgi:hypothetical protein
LGELSPIPTPVLFIDILSTLLLELSDVLKLNAVLPPLLDVAI